jgi:hypothetical protein
MCFQITVLLRYALNIIAHLQGIMVRSELKAARNSFGAAR